MSTESARTSQDVKKGSAMHPFFGSFHGCPDDPGCLIHRMPFPALGAVLRLLCH